MLSLKINLHLLEKSHQICKEVITFSLHWHIRFSKIVFWIFKFIELEPYYVGTYLNKSRYLNKKNFPLSRWSSSPYIPYVKNFTKFLCTISRNLCKSRKLVSRGVWNKNNFPFGSDFPPLIFVRNLLITTCI